MLCVTQQSAKESRHEPPTHFRPAFCTALAGLGCARRATAEAFEITKKTPRNGGPFSPEQYAVLREENTESPWTSPLNDEHRKGIFTCAACDLPLYNSTTKFDSGTGWPSFFDVLPNAVGRKEDNGLFTTRTEVRPALRRPSGACVRGRSAADRFALLHEWRRPAPFAPDKVA